IVLGSREVPDAILNKCPNPTATRQKNDWSAYRPEFVLVGVHARAGVAPSASHLHAGCRLRARRQDPKYPFLPRRSMSNGSPAPIALFAYDRPDHLAQVSEALARNPEASKSRLFVFLDAAKSDAAAMRVTAVRAQARRIEGFKSRQIVQQSTNQGIAGSIIQGVTRLTAKFGRVIVLEDDLLPSAHFLRYLNDALKVYENDARVISVHAYSYPVAGKLPET